MRQHIDREMLREWRLYWSYEEEAERVPEAGVSMADLLDSDLVPDDKVWVSVQAMTAEERQTFAKGCANRAQGYADRAQGYATSARSALAARSARSAHYASASAASACTAASAASAAACATRAADYAAADYATHAERETQLKHIKGLIK